MPPGVEGKTTDVIHGGRSVCLFVANVLKQCRCIKSEVNHLRKCLTKHIAVPTFAATPPLPPHFQHPLGGSVVVINHPPVRLWSPGLAALLSFFLTGLGQLYKGQLINVIVWFVFVSMGYVALILPGLILHFFCVLGALSGNPWSEGKTTVVRE